MNKCEGTVTDISLNKNKIFMADLGKWIFVFSSKLLRDWRICVDLLMGYFLRLLCVLGKAVV